MGDKITLTVDSQYVNWGIDQGIRELIQNGVDAETKGHPLTIHYNRETQTLKILNTGISIPRSSLLIGYSTKKGDNTQIGEYGEGYKLGCLALLKHKLSITIHTTNQTWTPILEHSEDFDREVLAFKIAKNEKSGAFVEFYVSGLTEDAWMQARTQFLMFDDKRKYRSTDLPSGQVLSGPDYKGRVYVGGIYVQQVADENFEYGYNFNPGVLAVDRDRKMADRWELKTAAAQLLNEWLASDPEGFLPEFERLLKADATDVNRMYDVPEWALRKIITNFAFEHGTNCVPVKYEGDVKTAGHYGRHGKVFAAAYVALLGRNRELNIESIRSDFATKIMGTVEPLELKRTEQKSLLKAMQAVKLAVSKLPRIEIATFIKTSNVMGLYHRADDRVTLNRIILKDYGKTLAVLLHEVAHREGDDGSKEHQDEMTRIWIAIVTSKGTRKKVGDE